MSQPRINCPATIRQWRPPAILRLVGPAKIARIAAALWIGLALPLASRAGDWPQFLGPERNGISAETGLLSEWPANGPREVWRARGGVGMAGVAIQGKQAITVAQSEGQQRLLAFDSQTGKPLWSTDLQAAYGNSQGDGPRGTPALDDNTAFVYTGDGVLVAVDRKAGEVRWRQNVVSDNGGKVADYGMACSPLLVGELVVVTVGAPNAALAAYHRESGKLAWTAGDDPAGYSSPALRTLGGVEQIVAFTGASCLGVEPKSGKQLWRYPFTTDYQCNIATPISIGKDLLISAGEGHGSARLSLTTAGGRMAVEEVWTSFGPRSTLKNEWQTSVLLDGKLYGFDNVGSAGPITHLTCVDAATGKTVWQQPRFGKGNLIAADGKLIMTTMKGELVVAKASPDGYHELGRTTVIGSTRQAPSLANGLLYLRDDRDIVCLDLKKQ